MTDQGTQDHHQDSPPDPTNIAAGLLSHAVPDPTNIAAGLLSHAVPIALPEHHPENPRVGDVDNIAESLVRFGQVRPIMVQESTNYVVAGNHTLKAAKQLGWTQIAAIAIDLPDDEALAYVVADNRLGQLGGYEDAALAAILERMMVAGKLAGTGYTPDQVDDMLAAMDALPEVEPGPTQAGPGITDEALGERFANRSHDGPLRQFVLMFDQETGAQIEAMFRRLERAWGMSKTADIAAEALRRATAEPPIEGLTDAERERADTPDPDEADQPESTPESTPEDDGPEPGEPT